MNSSRFTVTNAIKLYDIVALPGGDAGIVTRNQFMSPHWQEITVFPFVGVIKKVFGNLLGRYRFRNERISSLQRINSMIK